MVWWWWKSKTKQQRTKLIERQQQEREIRKRKSWIYSYILPAHMQIYTLPIFFKTVHTFGLAVLLNSLVKWLPLLLLWSLSNCKNISAATWNAYITSSVQPTHEDKNERFMRLNSASLNDFYSKLTEFGQHKKYCILCTQKEKISVSGMFAFI